MSGFWYLATPYSKHPRGIEAAYNEAVAAAVICIRDGVMVFSPIAHSHAIAVVGELPGHYEQWSQLDEAMISAAAGVIVVQMDGWDQSSGIGAEIVLAERLGKPVLYMPPGGPVPTTGYFGSAKDENTRGV